MRRLGLVALCFCLVTPAQAHQHNWALEAECYLKKLGSALEREAQIDGLDNNRVTTLYLICALAFNLAGNSRRAVELLVESIEGASNEILANIALRILNFLNRGDVTFPTPHIYEQN
ncbi:MAG: hypothetical protein JKY15_07315 [Deltaproteobacteria bacterium]|nr:hypothetical protein [Deltaproteobacteria bacterium]